MKRVFKILLSILLGIGVLCIAAYAYLGGFSTVVIEEQQMGPFTLVYKDMSGTDMSQVGAITHEIEDALRTAGFTTQKPFDVYYPDMKAEIGFIVDASEAGKLSQFGDKFKIETIPAGMYMTTTFPWKNPFSYIIGFIKVAHALEAHRMNSGYRKTWAATRHDGEYITYLQPIVKELIAPQ